MATLRVNNVGDASGFTNPITLSTAGALTATWPNAPANMPAVNSPDILKITVEPNAVNEELIYVTAYTPGATSATVTRAQEGLPAFSHVGVAWVHGPTALDFPGPAGATGPTGPTGAGVANPMTTAGDIIIGGTSGAQTRLPIGTAAFVLTVVSGAPAWATSGVVMTSGLFNVAVGPSASAAASYAVAMGFTSNAAGQGDVAIGYGAQMSSSVQNSVALGTNAVATSSNQIMLGQAGNTQTVVGALATSARVLSTSASLFFSDCVVLATSNSIIVTMPSPTVVGNGAMFFIKAAPGVSGVTIARNSSETIDGFSSYPVPTGGAVQLTTNGTNWYVLNVVPASVPMVNPMTAVNDLIVGGASGAPTRLAGGSSGNVLTASISGAPGWNAPVAPGMANPMTASGDVIIGGTSGAPTRLARAAGSFTSYLGSASGSGPAWYTLGFTSTQNFISSDIAINAAADFNITSINLGGQTGVWLVVVQVLAYDTTVYNTLDLYISPQSASTAGGYQVAAELSLPSGQPMSTAFFALVSAGSFFYLNGRGASSHGLVKASAVQTGLANVTGMYAVKPG